jgi:hypothetical protein
MTLLRVRTLSVPSALLWALGDENKDGRQSLDALERCRRAEPCRAHVELGSAVGRGWDFTGAQHPPGLVEGFVAA